MHGRKKVSIGEAERIKSQQKAKLIKEQYNQIMGARGDDDKERDLINTKTPILDYLDDFATLWNMRKEKVLHPKVAAVNPETVEAESTKKPEESAANIETAAETESTNKPTNSPSLEEPETTESAPLEPEPEPELTESELIKKVATTELDIAARVLMKNPKSYWGWHHRRWCIELIEGYDYHTEAQLVMKFIEVDSRNFHAWRHLRWAVSKCGSLAKKEFENTFKLIEKNFSNFSAWHYRSQMDFETDFKDEIELAKAAFWTDPNDQSPWIYYRWLLSKPSISSNTDLLNEEIESMNELIEEEPKSKYPLLAAVWLHRKLPQPDPKVISELIGKLCVLDPIRAPYYKEQ